MLNFLTPFYPTAGRDNNFDVLRLFAASLVIFSHSWSLIGASDDPIVIWSNQSLHGGGLGVWIFFFISGYLVSESFQMRGLVGFIESRFLRIYPAFLVSLIFGVVIGAFVTTLPIGTYIADEQTWSYVYRSLLTDIQFVLPGVFAKLPFANGINGSLWTIPIEIMMYAGVIIAGVCKILNRPTLSLLVIASVMTAFVIEPNWMLLIPRVTQIYVLPAILCFAFGMIFYTNKAHIPLHGLYVLSIIGLIIYTRHAKPPGNIWVCFAIAYTTAWFAFHPWLRVKIPPRIGDISYGLYVYAFPIQQTIIYNYADAGPWAIFAISLPITALVAWISWHLIEKRALALKGRLVFLRGRKFS